MTRPPTWTDATLEEHEAFMAVFPELDSPAPHRTPSAAAAAEARLLAFVLRDLRNLDHLPGLTPQLFGDDQYQAVLAHQLRARAAGRDGMDLLAIAAALPGVIELHDLVLIEQQADGMTPGSAASLIPLVKKEAARRVTLTAGQDLMTMGLDPTRTPAQAAEAMRRHANQIEAVATGRAADPNELPLGIVFSDELPEEYTPPEELVEGVLTVGAGSMLYGDSNSGKTYFVIDMACAVARGIPWMGRQVEQGLVVYVAAESPASVKGRLQAYQLHHRVKVPNFAIVQAPINMHGDDIDTEALIRAVKLVEQRAGMTARLVIGDTLARLAAGANENSVEDMGQIVRRMDRVRAETGAHFLVVHHSGKDAAKGARGSGSLRAAVDTEIEVTEMPTGERVAEMKKQRDLGSKGDRIGFRLLPIEVGVTKWGKPATNCIVEPAAAPEKEVKGRRMGEVEGAVVEFLRERKVGVRKAEVVKHFDGRYERSNVYRALRSLVAAQAAHEASGMVCIAEVAK